MGESGGTPGKRFTLTGLTSLSDTSLSPIVSKLVSHVIDKTFCGLKSPSAGGVPKKQSGDGAQESARSSGGSVPKRHSDVVGGASIRQSGDGGASRGESKRASGITSKRGSLVEAVTSKRPSTDGGGSQRPSGSKSNRQSAEGDVPPAIEQCFLPEDAKRSSTPKRLSAEEGTVSKRGSVDAGDEARRASIVGGGESRQASMGSKRGSVEGGGSKRGSVDDGGARSQRGSVGGGSKRGSLGDGGEWSQRGSLDGGMGSKKGSVGEGGGGIDGGSKRPSENRSNRQSLQSEGQESNRQSRRGSVQSPITIEESATSDHGRQSPRHSEPGSDTGYKDAMVTIRPVASTNRFTFDENRTPNQYPPGVQPGGLTIGNTSALYNNSTQVLVPITPLPEESELRVGPTDSFVQRHTIPLESEMGITTVGLRIHRNPGSADMDTLVADSTTRLIENRIGGPIGGGPTETAQGEEDLTSGGGVVAGTLGGLRGIFGGGADTATPAIVLEGGTGGLGLATSSEEFKTLIDEMASQVAELAIEGMMNQSGGFFNEVYKRLSNVAKNAARIAANSRLSRDGNGSSGGASTTAAGGGNGGSRLPPEVRDHILKTLSDIKNQLDTVRNKLKK